MIRQDCGKAEGENRNFFAFCFFIARLSRLLLFVCSLNYKTFSNKFALNMYFNKLNLIQRSGTTINLLLLIL